MKSFDKLPPALLEQNGQFNTCKVTYYILSGDMLLILYSKYSYVRSKAASRLGLLSRLRGFLTTEAYPSVLSYCDTCFCPLGSTNRKSLERLQQRAAKIVYSFKPDIATETILENLRWPPLTKSMEKHCVLLVNKCLIGEVPSYYKNYFMVRSQSDSQLVFNRCTRSSITDIVLPKFHLDVVKSLFIIMVHPYFSSMNIN